MQGFDDVDSAPQPQQHLCVVTVSPSGAEGATKAGADARRVSSTMRLEDCSEVRGASRFALIACPGVKAEVGIGIVVLAGGAEGANEAGGVLTHRLHRLELPNPSADPTAAQKAHIGLPERLHV